MESHNQNKDQISEITSPTRPRRKYDEITQPGQVNQGNGMTETNENSQMDEAVIPELKKVKKSDGMEEEEAKITTILTKKSMIRPTECHFQRRVLNKLPIVDKTSELFNLLFASGDNAAFVIGPRRFGKSFLASTVASIFRGNQKWWYENCSEFAIISVYKYSFPPYPVLMLDFSGASTPRELTDKIKIELVSLAKENNVYNKVASAAERYDKYRDKASLKNLFQETIIEVAAEKQKGVVIIVDEYDYALVSAAEKLFFDNANKQRDVGAEANQQGEIKIELSTREIRNLIKEFYDMIKALRQRVISSNPKSDSSVHFFYLTGILPLHQTSLFSCTNDVTAARQSMNYSQILGFTEEDILKVFKEHLEEAAEKLLLLKKEECMITKDDIEETKKLLLKEIRKTYNGFQFTLEQKQTLFSPFAINMLFYHWNSNPIRYPSYFADSGSSELVMMVIRMMSASEKTKFFEALNEDEREIVVFESLKENFAGQQTLTQVMNSPSTLGFLTGLFTIHKEKSNDKRWCLKLTNHEMRRHFLNLIDNELDLSKSYKQMLGSLWSGDYVEFFRIFNERLKNMSAFVGQKKENCRSRDEFEGYGHTLVAYLLNQLQNYFEASRANQILKALEFVSNKAVDTSQRRLDCWILFQAEKEVDGEVKVEYKAFGMEFKCEANLLTALNKAEQDLKKKYLSVLTKTKPKYSDLKNSEVFFVAIAIRFGYIQDLRWFELKGPENAPALEKSESFKSFIQSEEGSNETM